MNATGLGVFQSDSSLAPPPRDSTCFNERHGAGQAVRLTLVQSLKHGNIGKSFYPETHPGFFSNINVGNLAIT